MENTQIDLTDEIKSRTPDAAAAKLANLSGDDIVRELIHLSPGFAQDVLEALPTDARERATSAAPPTSLSSGSATRSTTPAPSAG